MSTTLTARTLSPTYAERLLAPLDASGVVYLNTLSPTAREGMLAASREHWMAYRRGCGYSGANAPLLTSPASHPKLRKSVTPTYGLTLVPVDAVGMARVNLCPAATLCRDVCGDTSGFVRVFDVA